MEEKENGGGRSGVLLFKIPDSRLGGSFLQYAQISVVLVGSVLVFRARSFYLSLEDLG